MTERLLETVVPLGRVNVGALAVAPVALAIVSGEGLDKTTLLAWVVAVWIGAIAQGLVLLARQWTGLTRTWELSYMAIVIYLGIVWGLSLAIPTTELYDLSSHLVVVCFLGMTSASAVIAFAGSLRLGFGFLLSQWIAAIGLGITQSRIDLVVVGLTIASCFCAYLYAAHRFLVTSVNAQVLAGELAEELRIHATTDPLTGLLNRRALVDALEGALQEGHRPVVFFVDLDGFKAINDTVGHRAGDEVLVECGNRLRSIVRPGDLVGRIGGDEFVILLLTSGSGEIPLAMAQRVTDLVSQPIGDLVLQVTASVGCAVPAESDSADNVLGNADAAMYSAKGRGGNRIEMYTRPDSDGTDTTGDDHELAGSARTEGERRARGSSSLVTGNDS